jgi:hypothetical protein
LRRIAQGCRAAATLGIVIRNPNTPKGFRRWAFGRERRPNPLANSRSRQPPSPPLNYCTSEYVPIQNPQHPKKGPLAASRSIMPQTTHPDTTASAAIPPPPDRDVIPPWLPVGNRWNELPEAVRDAVPRILVPAYREFVLDAPDELQRSVGLTLVHLLWLEVCDQMRLVEVVADPTSLATTLNDPNKMIDRHLNLVAAKGQTAELLVKLRLVNEALARSATPPRPGLSLPTTTLSGLSRSATRAPRPAPAKDYPDFRPRGGEAPDDEGPDGELSLARLAALLPLEGP